MKDHRSYTVTDRWKPTNNNLDRHFPQIWIVGNWLKDCGFEIGDKIDVECQHDKLIITKNREVLEASGMIADK